MGFSQTFPPSVSLSHSPFANAEHFRVPAGQKFEDRIVDELNRRCLALLAAYINSKLRTPSVTNRLLIDHCTEGKMETLFWDVRSVSTYRLKR
jgi:hypothetical protein